MNILKEIIEYKKEFVKSAKASVPFLELVKALDSNNDSARFADSIRKPGIHLIAEIKKASPSQGVIRKDFDAKAIARAYVKGGASCISVLTDEKFFQGSIACLDAVVSIAKLPDLRKDFIISEYQIYESKVHKADAILLIAAILKAEELEEFLKIAREVRVDALVEVHSEEELKKALDCGAEIIGINSRNLNDFSINLKILPELLKKIPQDKLCVSESGVKSVSDLSAIKSYGVDAVLVGEALMRSKDITSATIEFVSALKQA